MENTETSNKIEICELYWSANYSMWSTLSERSTNSLLMK